MKATIETITPTKATELLRTNTKNRNINPRIVGYYSASMKAGDWKLNGEAIKISEKNMLIDGQHRLEAIVKSGVSVPMLVIRDVSVDAMPTIDIGKTRSTADHLSIMGYAGNMTIISAAIRVVLDFKGGKFVQYKDKLTPLEAMRFLDDNRGLLHSAERVVGRGSKLVPSSILVAMHYLLSKVDSTKADIFFQQLFSGANLGSGSPVLVLRTRLVSLTTENKNSRSLRRMHVALIISAFNHFINGDDIQKLRYNPDADIELPKSKKQ